MNSNLKEKENIPYILSLLAIVTIIALIFIFPQVTGQQLVDSLLTLIASVIGGLIVALISYLTIYHLFVKRGIINGKFKDANYSNLQQKPEEPDNKLGNKKETTQIKPTNYYAELLNINDNNKDEDFYIILPSQSKQDERVKVRVEDMLAAEYMFILLTLAGISDEKIFTKTYDQFSDDKDYQFSNIILVGSSRANTATKLALTELNKEKLSFCVEFKNLDQSRNYCSIGWDRETYKTEKDMKEPGDTLRKPQEDKAILLFAKNPWIKKYRRLIIVAGIRGVGTWGAAKFLRVYAEHIVNYRKENNFCMLLRVASNSYKIKLTEVLQGKVRNKENYNETEWQNIDTKEFNQTLFSKIGYLEN